MIIKALFLGVVQGLTEFLPISSSGHLVIFQKLLGFNTNQLTFTVFLHFGTLIPVLIIFREDIKDLLLLKKEKRYFLWLVIISIIPTGIIGYFFEDYISGLFSSVFNTGFMLIITGILLYIAEKISTASKDIDDFKPHNALLIGIAQGLAVIPGISRSGTTIVASLMQGLKREEAARYSFIISLPVIFGAGLLELKDVYFAAGSYTINWSATIWGIIAAAVSGYLAIKYLLYILKTGSLIQFSWYCWLLGIIVILTAGLF